MKLTSLSRLLTYFLFLLIFSLILLSVFSIDAESIEGILYDREFLNALTFSFTTATFATLLSALFGIPAGFYLARNRKFFAKFLDIFFDIPLIIPPLVVGVLILNFFNKTGLNELFNIIFTFKGAVIAQFFISFPFTLKSSKSAFELVSPVYERIAMTLGAGPIRSFFDTTFKLASNGVFAGLILSWLRSFGEFGATLMVGGGIPNKTENVPINIYLNMTEGNFLKGLSASILTIFLAISIIFVVKLIFKRR